jgi:hypothetical protein
MGDHPQSSRLQVIFESALQDYQIQTGTALADHPLAQQLQHCDSIESVTAVLQEQARALGEFRASHGKVMKSLKRVVSLLYTLSASTAIGEAIGLVLHSERRGLIFYISDCLSNRHSHPQRPYLLALPSLLQYEFWLSITRTSSDQESRNALHQAVKDVSTSYDAIVDLLESIEHFINRLDIYTRVPPTGAMTEILVKIMAELISTLALVTRQIKQKRPSKCVHTCVPLA